MKYIITTIKIMIKYSTDSEEQMENHLKISPSALAFTHSWGSKKVFQNQFSRLENTGFVWSSWDVQWRKGPDNYYGYSEQSIEEVEL